MILLYGSNICSEICQTNEFYKTKEKEHNIAYNKKMLRIYHSRRYLVMYRRSKDCILLIVFKIYNFYHSCFVVYHWPNTVLEYYHNRNHTSIQAIP